MSTTTATGLDTSDQAEEPRFYDVLDLVALPTAPAVARMFVSSTLIHWHALFIEDYMTAVATELVTLAVQDTYDEDLAVVPAPIKLRMLGYERHIVFEVTDTATEAHELAEGAELVEDKGLALVARLASRWGSTVGPRGRVSWAELAVYQRTEAGLPLRPRPVDVEPSNSNDEAPESPDPEVLQHILDRLENL